jgi:hypothetical protein
LSKYGARLTLAQKNDLARLVGQAQKTSDTLRKHALENADEPAHVFRVFAPRG